MPITAKHWRVIYYLAWLVPVLIASFANYTVSAEIDADTSWLRYFYIHLFYWIAWGVIGEIAYKVSPQRLSLRAAELRAFTGRHTLMVSGVIAYFSIYFWAINASQFDTAGSAAEFLKLMYFRSGPIVFHVMNIVTYLIVLAVCLVIRQSRYAREQEEKRAQLELLSQKLEARLSESKLTALTSQIHPHFLFNAMNNIASLISTGSSTEAYQAVTLLAGLLRKTFQYVREPKITLKDEIELVVTMMKIGQLRFDDRLSWSVNMPDDLCNVPVPPFLIQPLAENALRHAVETTATPVHIDIDIQAVPGILTISVSDNGPGPTSGNNSGGLGLQNLKERLALMSDHDSGFSISAPAEGGFRVNIELPLETERG